jgi:4-alpha-glucanotransferase
MDSADVWVHPELFELDEDLNPIRIAGVPPDYFSPTGQRWGNPLYRWDVSRADRLRLVDRAHPPRLPALRHRAPRPLPRLRSLLGHSRRRRNRRQRRVDQGSRPRAFHALEAALGPLPLVAEDLGLITPEVEALRIELSLPGMKVLQFGFSNEGAHIHLPHRFTPRHCRLHRHPRQRHHAGLVECGKQNRA